ncbi:MAG TPA: aldolase/citrate lyase family protein [Chloroflexota bacterium]|nr:aldolase/citrate lyase family protein [Chloroflexota bacterium]
MQQNRFKQLLAAGGRAVGTMVFEFNTPGIARLLDATGVDFVVFDMEHSGFEIGAIRELISWSRGASFTPMVRVPIGEYHFLARALDVGAQGVMVPMVESRQHAEAIVSACKYPPQGRRGAAFGVAHDDFRAGSVVETMAASNAEGAIILQIETARGVENADEIAAVPGVDVLWIGHFDLSQSLGIPGQFDHPRFVETVDAVVAACKRHGRPLGVMVNDPATGRVWLDRGFRAIAYSGDIWLLQRALAEGVAWVRSWDGDR